MVARQSIAQEFKAFLGRIHHAKQVEVFAGDGAGVDHRLEVDDVLPILPAVDEHENFLGQLFSLGKGQNFKELVECAEAAGENDQRLGQVSEPKLPHEKVVKLEIQGRGNEVVRHLLEGKTYVEADAFSLGL